MDQATYQQWWQLHLRVARGDHLSSDERSFYDAGLSEIEQEAPPLDAAAERSQDALAAREAEKEILMRSRRELDAEIADLESRYRWQRPPHE